MVRTAMGEESTNIAEAAPRESASIPIAPVPANRSSTEAPRTLDPRLENTPSRARSDTGLVPSGTGPSRVPLACPAMILTAHALLAGNPAPTRDQIVEAISGNICRCTGYAQIVEAIALASERMRGLNQPVSEP